MKRTVDIKEMLREIAEVLAQWDGEGVAAIANEIMSGNVKYVGDSNFEITDVD